MLKLTSVSNEKVKFAVKIASSSRFRRENGMYFLEGLRLCHDAALSGIEIDCFFCTERAMEKNPEIADFISQRSAECYAVSASVAEKLAQTENPQGFFCLCKKSDSLKSDDIDFAGKYIALENIQDPANLGAVCRTAEALGISGAIVSGCCDRFSPKAQRAAMGSLLRLPVFESDNLAETLSFLKSRGMKLYATSPDSSAEKITDVSMKGGIVSVIGNEGNGVTQEVFALCNKVTIPMLGKAESLNASMAAAIVMWEMMRCTDD